MIEALNITDAYYRAAVKQAAPVAEVETTEARPVKKPTRVNDVSSKDDKNRMGAQMELTEEEQKYLEELKKRDREVRDHEAAHKRTAGQYAGAVSYTYQTGPDNKQYAIGGKTDLDTSEEPEPEDNIEKQQIIYDAALAPKQPSRKDKEVAADAKRSKDQSTVELREQEADERRQEIEENRMEDADTTPAPEPAPRYDSYNDASSNGNALNVVV